MRKRTEKWKGGNGIGVRTHTSTGPQGGREAGGQSLRHAAENRNRPPTQLACPAAQRSAVHGSSGAPTHAPVATWMVNCSSCVPP